eukprot:scaffold2457_cov229-Prasinococcus_capsulatus_cf.AAC.1
MCDMRTRPRGLRPAAAARNPQLLRRASCRRRMRGGRARLRWRARTPAQLGLAGDWMAAALRGARGTRAPYK